MSQPGKGRRGLYLLAAAGLLSLGVGGGTFATFNAQTTNPGNTFSTGSLTLTDAVTSGTTCFSYSGTNNANDIAAGQTNACGSIVDVTPSTGSTGSTIATGIVTLTNGGTLPASQFSLEAPSTSDCTSGYANTVANVTFTSGSAVGTTSSSVAQVAPGDVVTGTDIPADDTVAAVSAGQITLATAPTSSETVTLAFSLGSLNTTASLCNSAGFFVEEVGQETGGSGVTTPTLTCVTGSCPTYGTLGSALTSTATTLSLSSALAQAPAKGDTVEVINSAGQSVTYTVSDASSTTTTIDVGQQSLSDTFAAGDAVIDLSTVPKSAGYTLTKFDTNATATGTPLDPATPQGWASALPAGDSRVFQVGVYVPSATNTIQDLTASFGLSWNITA